MTFLLLIAAVVAAGCGSAGSPPPPVVATHLSVTMASATLTAGTAFNITVTALGASNAVASGYTGTVHFSSSDSKAVLPGNSTLTNGTGTFSVTLKSSGSQTVTATDLTTLSITGISSSATVSAAAASQFSVSTPASANVGAAFNFTVTAQDPFSNAVTSYTGTVHFTSSDAQAILPANAALTNGTGTFSATLKTAGSQTITATDTSTPSITGPSSPINIIGPLAIASAAPPNGTVGVSYGPISTISVRCVRNFPGGPIICTPCSSTLSCSGLPTCSPFYWRTHPTGRCVTTHQFYFGFPLIATGGVSSYAWSWVPAANSSLPPGLTLSNGKIAGIPTSRGTYDVIITVTDSASPAAQVSAPYTIVIAPPPPLTITSAPPPNGTLGSTYGGSANGFFLTASGGLRPYTWSWVAAGGSALPPGLNLSSDGVISGTATTPAGTYQVIVTVTDSEIPSIQTTANYAITIVTPPPPTISTSPAPAIGTVNVAYGYTFAAINGVPPFTWSETGALPPGLGPLSTAGTLSGTPTATGTFPITVQVQDALGRNSPTQNFSIQVFAKGFTATGSMPAARELHTATLLTDGTVLVTGGVNASVFFTQALLYDPAKGTFVPTTGTMTSFRISSEAVLLKSGKVLLVGGKGPFELATAELYDPATQTFASTTGNMATPRTYHTATLLNDGTVLVAGGIDASDSSSVATAELFDPVSETFTPVGNMGTARAFHTATLLPSGKVLIAGGMAPGGTALSTSELYDPSTKAFVSAGNLTVARTGHTATSLSDGKVLMSGGAPAFAGAAIATAEIFDPGTGNFTATGNMAASRSLHTATLRNDGTVLLTGGDAFFYNGAQAQSLSAAELFDPVTGSFSAVSNMTTPRESHTATLLNTGEVLIVGGSNGTLGYSATTVTDTAELYQ